MTLFPTQRHTPGFTRVLLLAAGIFVTFGWSAQADTAVSNLADFNNGDFPVKQSSPYESDRAQSFTTGGDPAVFLSATLAMDGTAVIPSGGFTVSLYGDTGGLPGAQLLKLNGSDSPAASGLYTYDAPVSLTLQPDTTYWIVADVPLTGPDSYYNWTFTAGSSQTGLSGWSLGGSATGVSFMGWPESWGPEGLPLRMEVETVPEPGTVVLLLPGVAWIFTRRRLGRTPCLVTR